MKMQDQTKKMPITNKEGVWAVSLSDSLPRGRLQVQMFSPELQSNIRKLIPSERASVKNPIDFGASGAYNPAILVKIIELLFSEEEVNAIVISGIGEMAPLESGSLAWEVTLASKTYEESLKYDKPIVIFTPLTKLSSASVEQMIDKGIPICHSISEVVTVLSSLHERYLYLQCHPDAARN
jgi:acyl-CoA synthetase (NDP forming)